MAVQIKYNGTTTNIEIGQVATLQCAGKMMTGDIIIGPPKNIITFSAVYRNQTLQFQAEEGMKWAEWCESDYNHKENISFNCTNDNNVYFSTIEKHGFVYLNNNKVASNDVILNGESYELRTEGSSD